MDPIIYWGNHDRIKNFGLTIPLLPIVNKNVISFIVGLLNNVVNSC